METVKTLNTYWGLVWISIEENTDFYGFDKRFKLHSYHPEFPRNCFYHTHPTLESALKTLKEEHDKFIKVVEDRISISDI